MSCAVFAVPETSREIPPEPEKPGTVPGRIGRRAARNLGPEFRESARLEKTLRIEVALQRKQMIVRLAVQCPVVLFTQLVPTIAIRSAAELHAFLEAARHRVRDTGDQIGVAPGN